MKFRSAALTVLGLLLVSGSVTFAQTTMTWTVDGKTRTALVFAPPSTPATLAIPHPLIFAFHGHSGTSQTAAMGMHLQTLWPEAIVVYPQGLPTKSKVDPAGNQSGWQVRLGQNGLNDRDLKFFDAMLATMHQQFA